MTDNQLHQFRILKGELADWDGLLSEAMGQIVDRDAALAQGYSSGELMEEHAKQLRIQINILFLRKARIYKVLRKISKEISEVENG